jgi:conjugal transfer/entry exclusion protein
MDDYQFNQIITQLRQNAEKLEDIVDQLDSLNSKMERIPHDFRNKFEYLNTKILSSK